MRREKRKRKRRDDQTNLKQNFFQARRRPKKRRKNHQVKLDMRQMPKTGRHEGCLVVRPNITLGLDGHSSE